MFLVSFLIRGLYPVKVAMLNHDVGFATVALATYTAYLVSMVPLFPGGSVPSEAPWT